MLNPDLRILDYAQAFAQTRAIAIPGILRPEAADAIYAALSGLSWDLEIKDYKQGHQLRIPITDNFDDVRDFLAYLKKNETAIDVKDLFYVRLNSNSAALQNGILKEFDDFLHSADFLETILAIVGDYAIASTSDFEHNCYAKGCFLGMHRDDHHPDNAVALAFNFSRNWKLDWGGFLMLQNMVLPPQWNALSVFAVPADHFISCVSPAATEHRYTVSGWLRRA